MQSPLGQLRHFVLSLLRKHPSLTTHRTLSHIPKARDFQCWDQSPFLAAVPVRPQVPHLTPLTQARFPYWIHPRFPRAESQMYHSMTQFIHCAVTQEPQLLPLKREPQQKNP